MIQVGKVVAVGVEFDLIRVKICSRKHQSS